MGRLIRVCLLLRKARTPWAYLSKAQGASLTECVESQTAVGRGRVELKPLAAAQAGPDRSGPRGSD